MARRHITKSIKVFITQEQIVCFIIIINEPNDAVGRVSGELQPGPFRRRATVGPQNRGDAPAQSAAYNCTAGADAEGSSQSPRIIIDE